jgi:hypothetical protein
LYPSTTVYRGLPPDGAVAVWPNADTVARVTKAEQRVVDNFIGQ